jgi:hypothetical protein
MNPNIKALILICQMCLLIVATPVDEIKWAVAKYGDVQKYIPGEQAGNQYQANLDSAILDSIERDRRDAEQTQGAANDSDKR